MTAVKDLAIVLPSKGRPHNMTRLLEAMEKTCEGDTTLIVGLDLDDPTRASYPQGPTYVVEDGLQRKVVQWINLLAVPRVKEYRFIGHFGDDCVPRTPGWDVRLMEALEHTPLAFADDMEYGQRPAGSLPTHIFMRSNVVRKLGYVGPPEIQHMYVDLAWFAWGNKTGITYLPDVQIEHMHFLEGKAIMDASYQLSRQLVNEDLGHLQTYVARRLNRDIRRISPKARTFEGAEFYQLCWSRGLGIPMPG